MSEAVSGADGQYDPFIANDIYPEPGQVFQTSVRSVEQIKDECIVVFDTNALLVPYAIGKESLEEIGKTYRKLAQQKRLVIPGQVAREFARHRPDKLADAYQQLCRKRDGLLSVQIGKYPLLSSLEEYQDAFKKAKEIDDLLDVYRNMIGKILDRMRDWIWNDPVSELYSKLFSDEVIVDDDWNREEIVKDLRRRKTHRIPPGYKDTGKEDEGIGDLLIWYSILKVGKESKKSVLFVSGEEKADWWHRSEKHPIYPRYELVLC